MHETLNSLLKTNQRNLDKLYSLKRLLAGPEGFLPFTFNLPGSPSQHAPDPGIEGFYYTLLELEDLHGPASLIPLLPYFLRYLSDLFVACGEEALYLDQLSSTSDDERRYFKLKAFLQAKIESLQHEVQKMDRAAWIRTARIYQIYPRAFNLAGRRNASGKSPPASGAPLFTSIEASDLPGAFDAIRWTGTYRIGEIDRKGIGSPFSIVNHALVDPRFGSRQQVRRRILELEEQGVRSIFELSPNHTAVDATMLEESPDCYIHTTQEPGDTAGYYRFEHRRSGKTYWIRRGGYVFDGTRYFWNDTLQLDISNPKTVLMLIAQLKELIRNYGVHGFRVDMAYQLLHGPFAWNWASEIRFPLRSEIDEEFFYKLIRGIKLEFPHVGFIAEGFYNWERLSAVGFDVIYSKNEMPLAGGYRHIGWYNALESRDPWTIREAIRRAAFLNWQKGAAGMICFVGHHDLPAPQRVFRDWVRGATFLTMFLPVARNWYAGTEASFEAVCSENNKMITFAEDVLIDWAGFDSDFGRFFRDTLEQVSLVTSVLGKEQMIAALDPAPVVGFTLTPAASPGKNLSAVVSANPTQVPQIVQVVPGCNHTLKPLCCAAFLIDEGQVNLLGTAKK